jgi:AbiJ-like protein
MNGSGLSGGPDGVLLRFLAQRVHPIVERDIERAAKIVAHLNRLLHPDGWMLKAQSYISGRPVYAAARIDRVTPTVDAAHAVAPRLDDDSANCWRRSRVKRATSSGPRGPTMFVNGFGSCVT